MRQHGTASSTYMFSVEDWLAQADISNDSVEMLRSPPDRFSSYVNLVQDRDDSGKLDAKAVGGISDLRLGLKGVCFKAVVVKKSDVRAVTSRNGVPLLVCSVTLSDGTGEIPLIVWNSQIGTISEGDRVEVRDARVRSFRGQIQLSLKRKTGSLTVLERAKRTPTIGILSHLIAA